jgi:S1-C subfamily serine protease
MNILKKLLLILLFVPLFIINCNTKKQKDSNSNISEDKPLVNQEIKKELTASDIYNSSKAKVVLLMTYDKSYIPVAQGSGFFINKNTLVTNYHVIEGSHTVELKVIGEDDFIKGAKIISASKKHDIAIIETKEDHSFFEIDSLNAESIGSKIYTIGNPRGLEGTISDGIISAKRKEDFDLIQITAPISPGNSGGPLINEKGKVIGVSTYSILNSQNINFAVPIKYINEIYQNRKN